MFEVFKMLLSEARKFSLSFFILLFELFVSVWYKEEAVLSVKLQEKSESAIVTFSFN